MVTDCQWVYRRLVAAIAANMFQLLESPPAVCSVTTNDEQPLPDHALQTLKSAEKAQDRLASFILKQGAAL